ncbi:hypothetical protein ACGF07_00480 [Kitasatospora sp. NPDC048194]|uniref:hypothetical protein n=1 Tax=Kitasatospora sp. NPDC048194 TaxID=3364045 RepID=UPI00371C1C91
MVEVHVKVRVCDKCRDVKRPIRSYTLTEGERVVERDLCEEHARPIEEAMAGESSILPQAPADVVTPKVAAGKAPAKKATARQRRGPTKTLTVEEIEALKRT